MTYINTNDMETLLLFLEVRLFLVVIFLTGWDLIGLVGSVAMVIKLCCEEEDLLVFRNKINASRRCCAKTML
jgi:hypothetical protein